MTEANLDQTLEMLDDGVTRQEQEDIRRARGLAERLGLPFEPLVEFHMEPELFRAIPVEVMLRYQFLPLGEADGALRVVMADPSNMVDVNELELALARPVELSVGPSRRIAELLEKSESTQRVLDEATEGFRIQLVQEAEDGEEVLSIDRITADSSPIIRLVDSVLFNAIQRRASDIHIETQDREVVVKYRIDGVLYQAMEPIDKRHHSTIVSRVKVMSELDIAEKRIPQDGRFKVRLVGPHNRLPGLDHAHGARRGRGDPHPRQGVGQRRVPHPQPRGARLRRGDQAPAAQVHQRALRDGAGDRARPDRARPPPCTPAWPRSRPPRTRSSPSRTRSSTSSRASPRSPSTRRRG